MKQQRTENIEEVEGVWKPFFMMVALTPIFLLVAAFSTGAGHGSYFLAMLLLPWPMLSALAFGSIPLPALILALLQFPAYGYFLSIMKRKAAFERGLIVIGVLHVGSVIALLTLIRILSRA